jgi:hypothetical protein
MRDLVTRPSPLRDYPHDRVRFACHKCSRAGQYRKTTLIERYGPEEDMMNLRLKVAANRPSRSGLVSSGSCGCAADRVQ